MRVKKPEPADKRLLSKREKHKLDLPKCYQKLFNTEEGKLVLYDLMEQGYIMRPTCQNTIRDKDADRNEGRREIVLHIIDQLTKDVGALYKLIVGADDSAKDLHNG